MSAIGIDLGTSRWWVQISSDKNASHESILHLSRVGVWRGNYVEIFENELGSTSTPAFVSYSNDEVLIGDSAKNRAFRNARNTVFNVKRLIGRDDADHESRKAAEDQKLPYRVVSQGGVPGVVVQEWGRDRYFTAQELVCQLVKFLKDIAAKQLDGPPTEAVITVPAHFNGFQRKATAEAGALAGLKVLRLITEPGAAMLAYAHKKQFTGARTVFVLDLGGGMSQAGVFALEGGVVDNKATAGYSDLGGEDYDAILVDHCLSEFKRKHSKDLSGNPRALRRLRNACEVAKRALSVGSQAIVEVDALADDIDFRILIYRPEFEELCEAKFRRIIKLIETTLTEARITKDKVDDVVMVGGSSRIPRINSLVQEFFGKDLDKSLHADEAVVYGSAALAALVTGSVSPMLMDLLLLDAYPFMLGIETKGGILTPMLKKHSNIPTKRTEIFTTSSDSQTNAFIAVYEGEKLDRARSSSNRLLGYLWVTGLPPAPRGVPRIAVTFDVSVSGDLTVTARDTVLDQEVRLDVTFRLGESMPHADVNGAYLLEPHVEPQPRAPTTQFTAGGTSATSSSSNTAAASSSAGASTEAPAPEPHNAPPPYSTMPAEHERVDVPEHARPTSGTHTGPNEPGPQPQPQTAPAPPPGPNNFQQGQHPSWQQGSQSPPGPWGQPPPNAGAPWGMPQPPASNPQVFPPNTTPNTTTPTWAQPQPPPPPNLQQQVPNPNPNQWWSGAPQGQWGQQPQAPNMGQWSQGPNWATPTPTGQNQAPPLPPRPPQQPQRPETSQAEVQLREMEERYQQLEMSHAALEARYRVLEGRNSELEGRLAGLEAVIYGRRQF
ncbi:hypothetical protein HGRIS_008630 [Hohenbuehelia grisea]|uniref:Heat shock protein 70 n=1 Tax=Hohenbuehelia grisea TaxID=104357 RepID=A0ABR3J903_9AGAR